MVNKSKMIFPMYNLLEAIENDTGFGGLDHSSRDMLVYVGSQLLEGKRINVSDLARNTKFGSPAKIYGRIALLESEGWLKIVSDPLDGRARLVSLSAKAHRTFEAKSAAITRLFAKAKP